MSTPTFAYDQAIRTDVMLARNYARSLYERTQDPKAREAHLHFQRMLRTWYPGAARTARRALALWVNHIISITPLPRGWHLDPSGRRITAMSPGVRVLRRYTLDGVTIRFEQYAGDGTLSSATEVSQGDAQQFARLIAEGTPAAQPVAA